MRHYDKLLRVLQKELQQQEKLLALLSKERAAIAQMNREEVENLTAVKGALLVDSRSLEQARDEIVAAISTEIETEEPVVFKDLVNHCSDAQTKKTLEAVASELKTTASTVKEMNDHNALLLKQTLGIIASTISIFRSAADADLPAYGRGGSIVEGGAKSPAPRSGQVREA